MEKKPVKYDVNGNPIVEAPNVDPTALKKIFKTHKASKTPREALLSKLRKRLDEDDHELVDEVERHLIDGDAKVRELREFQTTAQERLTRTERLMSYALALLPDSILHDARNVRLKEWYDANIRKGGADFRQKKIVIEQKGKQELATAVDTVQKVLEDDKTGDISLPKKWKQ